ncbi:MAG: sodium-dependent transporter [Acidobacteriota bacterium]|nr:sodium-dependent transporter [Acidobacteriota bacterium]
MRQGREVWATRTGLILAMAGNAVGLGNFLRFPSVAARNGGGAFMIPYFVALLLVGIPLMWVEWSMGRLGGRLGSGTTPRIFQHLWQHPLARYLGGLGIAIPLVFCVYYTYIESWTLAFAYFSATGMYWGLTDQSGMGGFLHAYQGFTQSENSGSLFYAYVFMAITLAANLYILAKGVVRGIERLAKIAMPVLLLFAVILVVRVFTLGAPDPALPDQTPMAGLAFLWEPDFSRLSEARVWLAAAGQIFFTLSVGLGTIVTYASYLKEKDDIVLSGLTTASTNEFAEVILGGCLAIPIAVAFFGTVQTIAIAEGGMFDLGFQTMPIIFQQLPLGQILATMWFLLLFFAGITSSSALAMPAVSFLQDEFDWTRRKAVTAVGVSICILVQPIILFLEFGFLDEVDFWIGAFGITLFAALEIVLFAWVFGMGKGWKEINMGADIRLPRFFYYVIKYVTPVFLLTIFAAWTYQEGKPRILMENVEPENRPYLWMARGLVLVVILVVFWLIHKAWARRQARAGGEA